MANLEAKAWDVEEYLKEAMVVRDAEIVEAADEARKEAMVKFKNSKEFVALLEKKWEAGCDMGYDSGVVDIFYNIWLKHRDID